MWIERIKENKELWDLFTRKEEYNPLLLDQYQRFPYYLSCNRDILKPKVSEILIEKGFDFEYPEGKKFAVCLTQDIDFNFEIEDLEHEIGIIRDRGWEVGLHGGHNAYNNFEEIKKEKNKIERVLNKKVVGYRNYFLRFKVPDAWELLSKAGFKYDTTLGYADMVRFRNGMCHPFKPFNLRINREIVMIKLHG